MPKTYIKARFAALFALGLASPALAEDYCGGVGAGGQWIGGSEAASNITSAGDYQEQMALVLGGNQYVALFSVSDRTNVRVEAAARGAGDTIIDLYDDNGILVLSDDDSGGNGASRGEIDLAPGTYCLAMRSYDNAPLTGFIRVGRTEHEALTMGGDDTSTPDTMTTPGDEMGGVCDSMTQATRIDVGTSGTGSASEVPYWRFSLDREMPVSITAENEDADPLITLYDGFGGYLSENDDFDGLNSRLDMSAPLPAGEYCIAMQALSDTSAPITVTISVYDPIAAMAALYDQGEAAPPLDGSHPVADLGLLETRIRKDLQNGTAATWFSVDVPEAGLILIEAIAAGGNGDPVLYLYDDLGRQIAYNDDNGDSYDSMVTARINPGIYLIAVKELNDGTQGLVRMVVERYVPAR